MNAADLRFVFDRLDMDHVRGCAEAVQVTWETGTPVFEVCYEPGDGTNYALLFTILRPGMPILGTHGGGSGNRPPHTGTGSKFDGTIAYVHWLQRERVAVFGNRDFATPEWVERNYGCTGGSAVAVAVLLNQISGHDPAWRDRMVAQSEELDRLATRGVE